VFKILEFFVPLDVEKENFSDIRDFRVKNEIKM